MSGLCKALIRRKNLTPLSIEATELRRCLGVLDLTFLGVGSTLGAGIYVVAGQVARDTAGPAVIISFFIAAAASFLAGLCYAEFAAKVPRAGSAYVYSYVTMGEFIAFVIGWNLILEYVIGTASVARAWSSYVDSISHDAIQHFFHKYFPLHIATLSHYVDFLALSLTLVIMVMLAIGIKESSKVNNLFCVINLLVVTTIIGAGLSKAHLHNWKLRPDELLHANCSNTTAPRGFGVGGFEPFGSSGILSGAATCFYAFVGFDAIATTGEEVRNPQKSLPIAILLCLFICFVAYFGVSAVLTLMVPYCTLDPNAPVARVFDQVGLEPFHIVVAVGALAGLTSSLLGAMIPMPRVIYAMAGDGLLFRFLAYVPRRFKTPITATVVSGVFSAVMAALFDLQALVEMLSIGTLLAYTIVALSVMVLRYQPLPEQRTAEECGITEHDTDDDDLMFGTVTVVSTQSLVAMVLCPRNPDPTPTSGNLVYGAALMACLEVAGVCSTLVFLCFGHVGWTWWSITILSTLVAVLLFTLLIIAKQPQQPNVETLNEGRKFQVPFVPLVPALSMFINIYLIFKLQVLTWIRFGVWMVIGLLIYFLYGICHSSERQRRRSVSEVDHSLLNS